MACTFTALVLRGRVAHLLHIGDTRAYRLRRDRLTCLTDDHARDGGPGNSRVLTRALGAERKRGSTMRRSRSPCTTGFSCAATACMAS